MNKVIEERTKRTEWYRDARFGMFIHWGLYAIPARGEWVRSVEQIPHEDYCHLTEEFTAENYNPREWARLAKKAGRNMLCSQPNTTTAFAFLTPNLLTTIP